MKRIILTIFLTAIILSSFAQQYKGAVVDDANGEPLVGATVQLFNKDNVYVVGTLTDSDGNFTAKTPQKACKVTVSFVGYERVVLSDSLGISNELGVIKLKSGTMLGEVVVSADLRKQSLDTDSYLITDSLRKGTASTSQLLEKLPGVRRDWFTDEITINGESDVVLIVNGVEKPAEYIKNINPKRIQHVDITYNPSGKYQDHAILVNLRQKEDYVGWDFSPKTRNAYFLNTDNAYFSVNHAPFTYTYNQWNFYASVDYDVVDRKNAKSMESNYQDRIIKKTGELDMSRPTEREREYEPSATMGVDYVISDNHRLSVQASGIWNTSRNGTLYDLTLYEDGTQNMIQQLTRNDYESDDYTVGLFYQGKLGNVSLNSDISYNNYSVDELNLYQETGTLGSENLTHGHKDYVRYYLNVGFPIGKKVNVSTDYALTWRKYDNTWQETGGEIYHSINNRNRVGLTVAYNPTKSFGIRAGVGWNNMKDKSNSGNTDHTAWEPGGWIYWKPYRNVTFRSYYNCFTIYPSLDNLSTNSYAVDEWITHVGNPHLKPSVYHSINNILAIDKWFTLSYRFERNDGAIETCYDTNDDGAFTRTFFNGDKTKHTLTLDGRYTLAKGLQWGVNLRQSWETLKNSEYDCDEKGHAFMIITDLNYTVPVWDLNTRLCYMYNRSKYPVFQGEDEWGMNSFSLVFAKNFLKGRMPVVLHFAIPVDKMNDKRYTETSLQGYRIRNYYSDINNSSFAVMLSVQFNLSGGKSTRKRNNNWVKDAEKSKRTYM